jgi:hypothetical protein
MALDNRRVLESYCQDVVTVLRQASRIFRREFMNIANIDVFQEFLSIASTCNNVFQKMFLRPNTLRLIPAGGYTSNVIYSKKAIMWLTYIDKRDRCTTVHGRRGRLQDLSVYGFRSQTNTVYEFLG